MLRDRLKSMKENCANMKVTGFQHAGWSYRGHIILEGLQIVRIHHPGAPLKISPPKLGTRLDDAMGLFGLAVPVPHVPIIGSRTTVPISENQPFLPTKDPDT